MRQKNTRIFKLLLLSLVAVILAFILNPNGRMSDVKGFFNIRFSDGHHAWPYSAYTPFGTQPEIEAVEYPVLTGLFQWIVSYLVPISPANSINDPLNSPNSFAQLIAPKASILNGTWPNLVYYRISIFLLAIMFGVSVYFLSRLIPNIQKYLYVFSPAILASLFLNWDVLCVSLLIASLYFYERKSYSLSAILLSLSISTKFYPAVVLLPLTVILWKERRIRELISYLGVVLGTWLIVNLPIALYDFSGWSRFYKYSYQRDIAGDGSFFQIIKFVGASENILKITYYSLNILVVILLLRYTYKLSSRFSLIELSYFAVSAFVLFGKVVSVQYVLWLTPLALLTSRILAKKKRGKVLIFFSLWQTSEIIYHWAFYNYLIGLVSKGMQGIQIQEFLISSALRFSMFLVFTIILGKELMENRTANSLRAKR